MLNIDLKFRNWIFTWSLLCLSGQALAGLNIIEAYYLALEKDPTYRAALYEKAAGEQAENIGRAGLLPSIAVEYQNTPYNRQAQENDQGQSGNSPVQRQYHSYSASLTMSIPLFNYEARSQYKMSVIQTMMANEIYRAKLIDLAEKVISIYLDTASAQDELLLITAQKKLYAEQLTLNQKLIAAGEGSLTDLEETRAQASLNDIREMEARDQLGKVQRELESITGISLDQPGGLQPLNQHSFRVPELHPVQFEEWRKLALSNNPELAALRHRVAIAKQEVELSHAGAMPRAQLYASHSLSRSAGDTSVNQKYETDSVGLRISVPLYSGGRVLATIRQNSALYGQTMSEHDGKIREILDALAYAFHLCSNGQSRLDAYERRVKAAILQVKATRKSVLSGQRINLDVLNAEQLLYRARFDLMTARYNYLKARVSLLKSAGIIDVNHIEQISSYFSIAPETRPGTEKHSAH